MATLTLAICARNAAGIIGPCLDSIAAQTLPPDRVLVAVDEPGDPTAQAARERGADVIVSASTGLYEARNAVLAACDTDYLAFTDADCRLVPEWVAHGKAVLDTRPEVAAVTGRHPPLGVANFVAWLHHMWFLVETRDTGETDGVIGGNSLFRAAALREVGGWLRLPRHSAAEDVYISMALRKAGHTIWFEAPMAAHHHYETRASGMWRKAVMMGRDIVVMLRAAHWRGPLWWYTLVIPLLAAAVLLGVAAAPFAPIPGLAVAGGVFFGTLAYLTLAFRSPAKAFPRWIARWILIWPYSYGILQGLLLPIPKEARP